MTIMIAMRYLLLFLPFLLLSSISHKTDKRPDYVLVIHGGAGTILKENMTAEQEKAYLSKLEEALKAGEKILAEGGSALDAINASINIMEDSPLFNAGKGAVYNAEGKQEMDASVMDGKTLNCGAVAGVSLLKNPINGARAVMEKSVHVMLSGKGAEIFAKEQGLELVDESYFLDERRLEQLKKSKERELDEKNGRGAAPARAEDEKFGTVGAVALDKSGNLAAGTSTGGMTNKRYGRIGDSPVIGAGTYANNRTCAISCTGHGEYFIRAIVAYDVSALMEYKKLSLQKAAEKVIHDKLPALGGSGGLIGVDAQGNITMTFNTTGMYRGFVKSTGEQKVEIYK